MKGSQNVINALQEVLHDEIVAINQYFLHAEMLENWGLSGLAMTVKKDSIDEMKHAELAIERILFLEGEPNMTQPINITVGTSVEEFFKADLALEVGAVKKYNDFVNLCAVEGDNVTRDIMLQLLKDEERHAEWLETQLELIRHLGIQNYLAAAK